MSAEQLAAIIAGSVIILAGVILIIREARRPYPDPGELRPGEYLARTRHPWRGAFPRKSKMHEVWALLRWPFYAWLLRRNCGWRHIGWALWESTETAGQPPSQARYGLPGPKL